MLTTSSSYSNFNLRHKTYQNMFLFMEAKDLFESSDKMTSLMMHYGFGYVLRDGSFDFRYCFLYRVVS